MNVAWVCPRDIGELMAAWKYLNVSFDISIWDCLSYSMSWEIWLGRNEAIFNSKSFEVEQIWDVHCVRVA